MSMLAYAALSLMVKRNLIARIIKGGVSSYICRSGGLSRQKTAQTLFLCRSDALLRSVCFAGVIKGRYKNNYIPFGYNRVVCCKFAAFFADIRAAAKRCVCRSGGVAASGSPRVSACREALGSVEQIFCDGTLKAR